MEPEKKSNGALVGLVIIIIILIVGGIYIWQSSLVKTEPTQKNPPSQQETVSDQDATALNALELEAEATDTSVGVDVNDVN